MSNLLKLTMILTKAKVADIATRRLLSFGDKMIKTNSKRRFTPLRPIAGVFWLLHPRVFWLLHPRKALYFFILQKSLTVAWSITKSIINKKV